MALLVKGAISFYLFNLFEKLGCFLSSIASDDRDGHGLAKNENWGAELPPTFWCRKTLLLMFSTIPVTSATSERTFSALRRPKEHQEAGAPEQLPTDVQSIKDTLDNAKIAKRIACANEQRKRTFWKI